MIEKSAKSVSIIGGADGPTSIFVAGKSRKQTFRQRMRRSRLEHRKKRMEKQIKAHPHTLAEVADYLKEQYHAVELCVADEWKEDALSKKTVTEDIVQEKKRKYGTDAAQAREVKRGDWLYQQKKNDLKESLILRQRPELLGELAQVGRPSGADEESLRNFWDACERRRKMVAEIPEEQFLMDFHIYQIKDANGGEMEICIEYLWEVLLVSYSGNGKSRKIGTDSMKRWKKIAKEIYTYYGVTDEDIRQKSERYQTLVLALCD